jgi:tRNA-modifying protein YgfZ
LVILSLALMANNPQFPWYTLPDHSLLSLAGRDATAFAQSQFMNDVSALGEGEWQWNGWLTPKGRVIALFALLRIDPDTVWMVLSDADSEQIAASLRRFVFRSKVWIDVRADLRITGRLRASERSSGHHWTGSTNDAVELDLSGNGGGRALRIVPPQSTPAEHAAATLAWKRLDLAHGWPRLDASQREQWTPQQLSLDRLGAYSVKKGCYPGQEIVARTHFLGQAKRGLARILTTEAIDVGSPLEPEQGEGHSLGTVIATAGDTALAVIALTPPTVADTAGVDSAAAQNDESPAMRGAFWRFEPLLAGLKR